MNTLPPDGRKTFMNISKRSEGILKEKVSNV